jgi:Mn2+/Fe2+ NRAMP family transporter
VAEHFLHHSRMDPLFQEKRGGPYLFFWQASSEVDELRAAGQLTEAERRGVTRRELSAARTDVTIGMLFSQVVMYCIILTGAVVLNGHGHTNIQTAQQAAEALKPLAGPFAFVLFSLGLIGTGLLAIPVGRVRCQRTLWDTWQVEREGSVPADVLRDHDPCCCSRRGNELSPY